MGSRSSFSAQGNLLETKKPGISYAQVKQTFWLKLQNNDVVISLDGSNFQPLEQVISCSFSSSAGSAQALLDIQRQLTETTHYTSVFSMSKTDVKNVREFLVQTIAKSREDTDPLEPEKVFCLFVDFFKV